MDRECFMQKPSVQKFTKDLVTSQKTKIVYRTRVENEFTVRHFAEFVTYSAVHYIVLF